MQFQNNVMLSLSSMCGIISFLIVMTGAHTRKRKALFLLEFSAMILLLSARYTWMFNGQPGTLAFWMVRINNFFDFFAVRMVLFGFNLYIQEMFREAEGVRHDLLRFKISNGMIFIDSFLVILSQFNGMYYVIDETNTYSRGWAIGLCFSVPIVALAIQVSLIIQYYRYLSKNMRLSVLLFVIAPFPATVMQFIFYGLESTNLTIVAMSVLLYIFDLADINKTADMSIRAIAANEAKSAFLSNMSHEIRTPINAVLGMNEMILRESDDEEILSYAENIKTAGSTLLGIINDILDFSKIEAGKIEIIPVDYDLSSLIHDLVNMIYTRTDAKGLELKLDIDRSLPKLLNGDEVRIKQVITNILTNAAKYTEKGSVTFQIRREQTLHDPDRVIIRVAVIDTGIGIKDEDRKKLFSKFERIEEERNRNIEGTGLGMSITQSLLAMMGSELQVESVYGQGSTFSFVLEQRVVNWDELGDYEQSFREQLRNRGTYHEKLHAPDARILVVDDNRMNLAVFQSLVKQTRIRVDTAESGDEGLSRMADTSYDVIFLDHLMPEKDGIETLKELRAQAGNPNAETPVICLTANAISGAREQYIAAGFKDYLTKPIDPDALEEMLLKYLPAEKITAGPGDGADEAKKTKRKKDTGSLPEELKPLERQSIIDVRAGITNCGSPEAYRSILQMLYEAVDDSLTEIDGYYAEEKTDAYTVKVHALKSTIRVIGAAEVGEHAQALENAGKRQDIAYIRAHHGDFVNEVLTIRAILSQLFETGGTPKTGSSGTGEGERKTAAQEADPELLEAVFGELKAVAERGDGELIRSIIDEMGDYRIPEGTAALWEEIRQAAEDGEYQRLADLLAGR
ncbi:MAG: response regulator [Lachnospiraceae bacterium]|nr:response regulator [Lachnospiraceae bacterium]